MKNLSFIVCFLCIQSLLIGQWELDPYHTSFRLDNSSFDEYTHWTPNDFSFWADPGVYNIGSNFTSNSILFYEYDIGTLINQVLLNKTSLNFTDSFGDRVTLDYDGLSIINGASYQSIDQYIRGNAGQLDLYTGINTNYLARLGSSSLNSNAGALELYNNDGFRNVYLYSSTSDQGRLWLYGLSGINNVYAGAQVGAADYGWVYVADAAGDQQAGMYVDVATGDGIVYGDTKSFKIPHPERDDMDIWYACIEGPEAAIYERGTGQLQNGEAFIPYSDVYAAVANPTTATVNLTSQEWDTYGLAVVDKTDRGFYVKELKGGLGNFKFDWEVKSVRAGKENFQVIRPKDYLKQPGLEKEMIQSTTDAQRKNKMSKTLTKPHIHGKNCQHK